MEISISWTNSCFIYFIQFVTNFILVSQLWLMQLVYVNYFYSTELSVNDVHFSIAVQASIAANTWVVSGPSQTKSKSIPH